MNTSTQKSWLYGIAIILVTLWIYFGRIFFDLGYGWEVFALVFFAPPFLALTVFAILGVRKSLRVANPGFTGLQTGLFYGALVSGILLGLVSPAISDARGEESVLINDNPALVYVMGILVLALYVGILLALTIISFYRARKLKPISEGK